MQVTLYGVSHEVRVRRLSDGRWRAWTADWMEEDESGALTYLWADGDGAMSAARQLAGKIEALIERAIASAPGRMSAVRAMLAGACVSSPSSSP